VLHIRFSSFFLAFALGYPTLFYYFPFRMTKTMEFNCAKYANGGVCEAMLGPNMEGRGVQEKKKKEFNCS
jgi:hypothetical protein